EADRCQAEHVVRPRHGVDRACRQTRERRCRHPASPSIMRQTADRFQDPFCMVLIAKSYQFGEARAGPPCSRQRVAERLKRLLAEYGRLALVAYVALFVASF